LTDLHAGAGLDGGRALDRYRELALRVFADDPTLLSGRRSRLVLSAPGPAEIRAASNVGLAWGAALVIGTGALSTMLYQGDRLDWFNSSLICVLGLVSAVAIPLFLVNEWFHPLPFLKLQMLGRRNIAYGALGLFTFLLISQSGSTVPLRYLQEIQG
jgi:hypothetical protein